MLTDLFFDIKQYPHTIDVSIHLLAKQQWHQIAQKLYYDFLSII